MSFSGLLWVVFVTRVCDNMLQRSKAALKKKMGMMGAGRNVLTRRIYNCRKFYQTSSLTKR